MALMALMAFDGFGGFGGFGGFDGFEASYASEASIPVKPFRLSTVDQQIDDFTGEGEGFFSGGKVVLPAQVGHVTFRTHMDHRPAFRATADGAHAETARREVAGRAGGDEDVFVPMGVITFEHEEL